MVRRPYPSRLASSVLSGTRERMISLDTVVCRHSAVHCPSEFHSTADRPPVPHAQLEITLWVVITAALPAMVADRGVALAAHQTGIVLACGTAGSTVRCPCATAHLTLYEGSNISGTSRERFDTVV